MTLYDFLSQVVGLFDSILRALMGQPIMALLLAVLVFLVVAGMFGWLIYLGRQRRL